MSEALQALRLSIASRLLEVQDLLPPDYKLTLVCRHPENAKNIMITEDEPAAVIDTLQYLIDHGIEQERDPFGLDKFSGAGS